MFGDVRNLSDLFTTDEKIDFLKRKGYTVEMVKFWRGENAYHNKIEYISGETLVSYKDKLLSTDGTDGTELLPNSDGEYAYHLIEYRIDSDFTKELKLNLLR